ncbi:flavodoxin [Alkalispirochaeta sphaeroplastigenens]|uniref:Flavodoxin n=1 Tax=Alkalispirochaeta sphaeroplastigenens TaxID=1187066 RepID=A0A2S4JNF4_9SPIO|nr:flavodoxin [Alkalispirochaeta sphaeroplastigenens]POR01032.1 flavodoxin [Alkalispirochaeta sphaeroplastigenens]
MAKTLIVFGSSTGVTEDVARSIGGSLEEAVVVNVTDWNEDSLKELDSFDLIVLGASTWGIGDLQDDWHVKLGLLENAPLAGKKVALFGTGDQESYPDSFVDALGILAEAAEKAGATIVGQTSTEGYTHEESRGVRDGLFLGLAIDQDNQGDLTPERISSWVSTITSAV